MENPEYMNSDEYGVNFLIGNGPNSSLDSRSGAEALKPILNYISERRRYHISELSDAIIESIIQHRDDLKKLREEEWLSYDNHPILLGYWESYGPYTEQDRLKANPLHSEVQKALGFLPSWHLFFYGSKARSLDLKTMVETLVHIYKKGLPAYLTLTDRLGVEKLVQGSNPSKKIVIHNANFDKKPHLKS